MKNKREIFVSILIVFAGIVSFLLFLKFRVTAKKVKFEYKGPLVEVMVCKTMIQPIPVEVFGTVDSLRKINLVPQVSGKIVKVSDRFKEGGFFRKGEALIFIEDTDYKIALEKAKANLENQKLNYKQIEKKARIAKKQWEDLHKSILKGNEIKPDELTLYIPQMKAAKASLLAAQAGLKMAELNLERTVIKAPFDCVVLTKKVDKGQVVSPQVVLASVYATDSIEVVCPLTEKQYSLIERGNRVYVFGEGKVYPGVIDRFGGNFDLKTRMINAYIRFKKGCGIDLKLYSLVKCRIQSVEKKCAKIPLNAYRDGKVWLYEKGRLKIKKVQLIYETEGSAYVSGLPHEFNLITTNLYAVSNGMKVRVLKGEK